MNLKYKVSILVEPTYLEDHSDPAENSYLWAYTVKIKNNSKDTIKLISRHWKIFDSNGSFREVKGKGVVGEQPHITPGEEFQYTSGAMIETALGTMKGTYQMIDDNEHYFDAEIPEFILSIPRVIH